MAGGARGESRKAVTAGCRLVEEGAQTFCRCAVASGKGRLGLSFLPMSVRLVVPALMRLRLGVGLNEVAG